MKKKFKKFGFHRLRHRIDAHLDSGYEGHGIGLDHEIVGFDVGQREQGVFPGALSYYPLERVVVLVAAKSFNPNRKKC